MYELKQSPKSTWLTKLTDLQTTFGIPLKLISKNDVEMNQKMQRDLKRYATAYLQPNTDQPISTVYFKLPETNELLKIGPIQYTPLSSLFSVAQRYYFISFAIAAIIFVVLLTWLFSRNVIKIYQLTRKYSNGDFNANIKIGRTSILQGVYKNIISMGKSLNQLVQSQNNMTRFVAHEIRTPLATMQFALDSLKKDHHLSTQSQENVVSIEEDIQEINSLISYFLLYYQTTTHELTLKNEHINILEWLSTIINKFTLSKIKLSLITDNQDGVFANADPNLLKHSINNLITNALKFAHKNIIVSLSQDSHHIIISIEDDGPGIPETELKNIFKPFNVLDKDQAFGKHIGLGLSIAESIVELHKGTLSVSQSTKLGGAKSTIKLPGYSK